MARKSAEQTVERLLAAGRALVASEGRDKLTLDRLVGEARLSKGALLYHFKSKTELTRRIMLDAIEHFDARVAELRGADRSPGSYTRAYALAALGEHASAQSRQNIRVIAELAHDPEQTQAFNDAVQRWSRLIEDDGLDPVLAEVLRLACDGLYWNESIGAEPLTATVRSACLDWMLRATRNQPV